MHMDAWGVSKRKMNKYPNASELWWCTLGSGSITSHQDQDAPRYLGR